MDRTITTRDYIFFGEALQFADKSRCNYKHAALLVKSGKPIATATNKKSGHKIQRKYHEYCITLHAEIRCIMRAKNKKGSVLYSARISKRYKSPVNSKPCNTCRAIMRDAGIHTMVYFDGKQLVKERV